MSTRIGFGKQAEETKTNQEEVKDAAEQEQSQGFGSRISIFAKNVSNKVGFGQQVEETKTNQEEVKDVAEQEQSQGFGSRISLFAKNVSNRFSTKKD